MTEEKDAIYNSLANAEAYIEQLLAENKNIQQKIQSQPQPQPAVNTVAESAKIQSLTREMTETQNRLKAAEAEVQRVKKELQSQKPSDSSARLEAEVKRLLGELEEAKK